MSKIDVDAKELLEIQVNQKRNRETIKENQKVPEIGCLQLWLMVYSTTVSEKIARFVVLLKLQQMEKPVKNVTKYDLQSCDYLYLFTPVSLSNFQRPSMINVKTKATTKLNCYLRFHSTNWQGGIMYKKKSVRIQFQ